MEPATATDGAEVVKAFAFTEDQQAAVSFAEIFQGEFMNFGGGHWSKSIATAHILADLDGMCGRVSQISHGELDGCCRILEHSTRTMPPDKSVFSTKVTHAEAAAFKSYCHQQEQTPTQAIRGFIIESTQQLRTT